MRQGEIFDVKHLHEIFTNRRVFTSPKDIDGNPIYNSEIHILNDVFINIATDKVDIYELQDVTGTITWVQVSSASSELANDITVTANITGAGVSQGDVIPAGTSFTEFVEVFLTDTFEPTFTNPTFSISSSGNSLRVIGSSTTFNLTFNFNRGAIKGDLVNGVWDANATQDFRAGASTSYTIDGVAQTSNLLERTVTVSQGNNTFNGTVTYTEGVQPYDSALQPFGSPYPAGTSPSRSTSFEGVYPIYASTSDITTSTEQTLRSMISANNLQYDLVAESGGNKQFFEIPDTWLTSRPLTKVEFFNTVSGSFDTTNQLSTFTTSATTKTIETNTINYTRYTNNSPDRGGLRIKLIF